MTTKSHSNRAARLERGIAHASWRITQLERIHNRFANARLTVLIGGLVGSGLLFILSGDSGLTAGGVLLTISSVVGLAVAHRRYQNGLARLTAWRALQQGHRARLHLDWERIPSSPLTAQADHPFEHDVDLLQVHRLLNTATSYQGAERLHAWLLNDRPDADTIAARQAIVGELAGVPNFRAKLAVTAGLAAPGRATTHEGRHLQAWLEAHPPALDELRPIILVLSLLALLTVALMLPWAYGALPPLFLGTFIPYVLIYASQRGRVVPLFEMALELSFSLRKLVAVFGYIEEYRYGQREHLRGHCAPILEDRPSARLRGLEWVVAGASVQQNPYAWLFLNAIMPWDLLMVYRLNQLQDALTDDLPRWLEAWFSLEALASLANYAYLNPQATFPQILVDEASAPVFQAQGIGHPLIRADEKVRNDFTLDHLGQIVIITGSNMSGKSSFLRTLGVNLAMAFAGGAVDAASLQTRRFRLFSSIRITDSLDDGFSYFYAEVRRLRALLMAWKAADELPVFFLIDEIFRGTNNRERLIGSRSYIQALVDGHGVGFIATHDLELTALAEAYTDLSNYHFREHVAAGRMVFDYQLHEGPCPTTNALKIMAAEGLPVEQIDA